MDISYIRQAELEEIKEKLKEVQQDIALLRTEYARLRKDVDKVLDRDKGKDEKDKVLNKDKDKDEKKRRTPPDFPPPRSVRPRMVGLRY